MQTIKELTVELNRLKIKKTAITYTISSSSQNFKTFGHILEKIDSQLESCSSSLAISFIDCLPYWQVLQLRNDSSEVQKIASRLSIDIKYITGAIIGAIVFKSEG